jgi:hypothetical protein
LAAMRAALTAAAAALEQGCSSMDAVKAAICALEVRAAPTPLHHVHIRATTA